MAGVQQEEGERAEAVAAAVRGGHLRGHVFRDTELLGLHQQGADPLQHGRQLPLDPIDGPLPPKKQAEMGGVGWGWLGLV